MMPCHYLAKFFLTVRTVNPSESSSLKYCSRVGGIVVYRWRTNHSSYFSNTEYNTMKSILTLVSGGLLQVLLLSACGGGGGNSVTVNSSASAATSSANSSAVTIANIVIDTQTRHQTIAGFGAAVPMWTSNMLTEGEVQMLVGRGDDELGLSILRTMIDPTPSLWPRAVDNLLKAKSYTTDLQILASPWSPPAAMKDNNSTVGGGKLLPAYYDDYAAHLNDYVAYMAGEGVVIDVVSVQNEPDWHPDYDSCDWSGEELRNFVRDNASVINAKVLVGESLRFDRAYTDPSLNDEAALANFEMVGGHLYSAEDSGTFTAYPLAEAKNKERWMTEWLIHDADGSGAAIWGGDNADVWNETLDDVLLSIHKSMENDWNAYIWWWARRFYSLIGDGDESFGTTRGDILKRGWAFAHYSKHVRPGYTRVSATLSPVQNSLDITAYEGSDTLVVVLLNRSTANYDEIHFSQSYNIVSAEAYVTSQQVSHGAVVVTVEQEGQVVIKDIPARSVITVVMHR